MANVDERLERLERSLSQWKMASAVLGGTLALGLAYMVVRQPSPGASSPSGGVASTPGELVATGLTIKDKAGEVRARFYVDEKDSYAPVYLDLMSKGKRVASFTAINDTEAGVEFFGPSETGSPTASYGFGGLSLGDEQGRVMVRLSGVDHEPTLEMYSDAIEKKGLMLSVDKQGAQLDLYAPERVTYTTIKGGKPANEILRWPEP